MLCRKNFGGTMTFLDYFEQISNIPVLIVLFCLFTGIFYVVFKKDEKK